MLWYTIVFLIMNVSACKSLNISNYKIAIYEYGKRYEGEDILKYNDTSYIPEYTPLYNHVINVSGLKDWERDFSYVKVDYLSPLSQININYHPNNHTISFFCLLPFLFVPFSVTAYSLPPLTSFYINIAVDIVNRTLRSSN